MSKYHHLLLPAGHPGPRAHSWPLRPFPISSKFIQPILTKNWPSCCCKLDLYFKRKPLSRRSTQTFTRAAGSWPSSPPPSFSRLPAGQNCIVFHLVLVFGWNMIVVLIVVMVMVVLWVTVVDFLLLGDSNGPSFSLGCYNLHDDVNLKRQCLKSSTCRVMDVFLSEGIEVFPSPTLQPPSCEIFKKISKLYLSYLGSLAFTILIIKLIIIHCHCSSFPK